MVALKRDVLCYEVGLCHRKGFFSMMRINAHHGTIQNNVDMQAFARLMDCHFLSAEEETELLCGLPIEEQVPEDSKLVGYVYQAKLKKVWGAGFGGMNV